MSHGLYLLEDMQTSFLHSSLLTKVAEACLQTSHPHVLMQWKRECKLRDHIYSEGLR